MNLPRSMLFIAATATFLAAPVLAAEPAAPGTASQAGTPAQAGSNPAHADAQLADEPPKADVQDLHGITVTAVPAGHATPTVTLSGVALDKVRASTIGETVASVPGVHTASMGQAVGRPVIHGMGGPRVAVTENGMGTGDVSTLSQDHAVAVEPFLADKIEVLKGPATLTHGSGAIGGVVNVEDGRIPDHVPSDGFSGRASLQYDSVSEGNTAMFRIDTGGEHFALHADGVRRHDGNYDTPQGKLANSWVDTRTGALGASVLGDWGHVGFSVARYLDDYGSPAEPGDPITGEPAVSIDMAQTRYQLQGHFNTPFAGATILEINLGKTDYQHTEFEGLEPGTVFLNTARSAGVKLQHQPLAGWDGSIGVQYVDRDFAALGEESFIPPVESSSRALYVVEHHAWDHFDLHLGARTERSSSRPATGPERSFSPLSFSAIAGWKFTPNWHMALYLARSQRAPGDEELYANGPHAGSASFEIGDATLGLETGRQGTLELRYRSRRVGATLAIYRYDFDGFIYMATTDAVQDGFPVRRWSQADANFTGIDAETTIHLAEYPGGHWDLRLTGDRVRAERADGSNLPRIPATRLGAEVEWGHGEMHASLGAKRYFNQNDTAPNETPTDGFTLVNLDFGWTFRNAASDQWELFVRGSNLANETARLATSLFKEHAPLPGRSLTVGVRGWF